MVEKWELESLQDTNLPIRLADGTVRSIQRRWKTEVRLGNDTFPVVLYILPGDTDEIILGLDFLTTAKAEIHIGPYHRVLQASMPAISEPAASMTEIITSRTAKPENTCTVDTAGSVNTCSKTSSNVHPSLETQFSCPMACTVATTGSANTCSPFSVLEEQASSIPPQIDQKHFNPTEKILREASTSKRTPRVVATPPVENPSEDLSLPTASYCNLDHPINIVEPTPELYPLPAVPEEAREATRKFLLEEIEKFDQITGLSNIVEHRIVMKDDRPIKQRYYPRNPAMQAIIDEQVAELLEKGCVEPSHSPFSSPIVLVKKKNGTWRMCIDFRQINAKSIPDAYPLPRIHHILNRLRNAQYISCLDLKNGYWQIPMEVNSRKYTAFTVPGRGLYQWKVMPFGLHSAPATFQRALDRVLGADLEPHAFAYLDDIIITAATLEQHFDVLREVLKRLRDACLRINPEKCEFFKDEVKYLGHLVTREGIRTDPDKVAAVRNLPAPTTVRELRRCLGMASWYRRFVPEFSRVVQPMTNLLRKGKHFKWQQEQQAAFELLKQRLTEAPVLACPDFSHTFVLQTDASDMGIAAVLTQEIEAKERVIAYASRKLTGAEINYSATEKECLAIIWGIHQMREYLEGYRFIVVTDHLALKWLNNIQSPTDRLARWALDLQQFQFEIRYRKGKYNVVADALSRQPLPDDEENNEAESVYRIMTNAENPFECKWWTKTVQRVHERPETVPDYAVVNEQLYRHVPRRFDDEGENWKLCVPKELRNQVYYENHDAPAAGHLGIRKTCNRVANRYFWPGMFRDVAKYVRNCSSCQRFKPDQQRPAGKLLTNIPEEPWSVVCADFVGPLPRSRHGNHVLLVLTDKFSKWTELIPLRGATTENLQKAIRERIIARFGTPRVFWSDNGTQFTSRKFRNFLEDLGIRQQFTAPYTPQENTTERMNRTVKTMIAQYTEQDHRGWDETLPELQLAINTAQSEATGYSAAFLVQGREPRLPRALYDEVTLGGGSDEPHHRKSERLKEIFKLARHHQQLAHQQQAKYYNLRRRDWKPNIGQRVLIRDHPLSKAIDQFAAKLAPKYTGPYIVINFISPVIIEAQLEGTRKTRRAHLQDLKPYHEEQTAEESDRAEPAIGGQ